MVQGIDIKKWVVLLVLLVFWTNKPRLRGSFFREATVNDLKMFVRIIKGDLKIQVIRF